MKRFFQEVGISVAENLHGVYRYRGIRYAAPPTGSRRLMPPVPWQGPVVAAAVMPPGGQAVQQPMAPQLASRLAHVMGPLCDRLQFEDCLTLTVTCPPPVDDWGAGCPQAGGSDASRTRLLPVLVWLHGGGWSSGAGDLPWYDAALLVREGPMVVVSPNARLGALGYLVADGLSDGNLGLLDQEAVLLWVQQHIEQFGGNPKAVTVVGQSAGGSAVAQLLVRRALGWQQALFQRAILQSPALGVLPYQPAQARLLGAQVVGALGALPRHATVPQWLGAQAKAGHWARQLGLMAGPVHPPFAPVADGVVLPQAWAYGAAIDQAAGLIDVLLGWGHHELGAFTSPTPTHSNQAAGLDPWFAAPTWRWAQCAAQQGRRAWVYQFDWAPAGSALGACHCIELPFVFGTLGAFARAPMLAGTGAVTGAGLPAPVLTPVEQAQRCSLSRQVRQAWVNFVCSGDPNQGPASGLPSWPPAAQGRSPVMHLQQRSYCTEVAAGWASAANLQRPAMAG